MGDHPAPLALAPPQPETTVTSARIVVISLGEFRQIVEDIVEEGVASALAAAERRPTEALLSRNDLAKQLGVSAATVDRQTNAGMPFVLVGDRRRYELSEVLGWLRRNSDDGDGTH